MFSFPFCVPMRNGLNLPRSSSHSTWEFKPSKFTFSGHSDVCQLFLSKTGKKTNQKRKKSTELLILRALAVEPVSPPHPHHFPCWNCSTKRPPSCPEWEALPPSGKLCLHRLRSLVGEALLIPVVPGRPWARSRTFLVHCNYAAQVHASKHCFKSERTLFNFVSC